MVMIEKTTGKLGTSGELPIAKYSEAYSRENFPLGKSGGADRVGFPVPGDMRV
jgi:hypothetical protein